MVFPNTFGSKTRSSCEAEWELHSFTTSVGLPKRMANGGICCQDGNFACTLKRVTLRAFPQSQPVAVLRFDVSMVFVLTSHIHFVLGIWNRALNRQVRQDMFAQYIAFHVFVFFVAMRHVH